jgi:hypothetical protein
MKINKTKNFKKIKSIMHGMLNINWCWFIVVQMIELEA